MDPEVRKASASPVVPRLFTWITLTMASAQFVRCYMIQTYKFLNMHEYAAGVERMPFQGRVLMMFPLRWAESSPLLLRVTSGEGALFHSPMDLVISVVGFLSVMTTGVLVTMLYRRRSPTHPFTNLPFAFMLVFLASNYLLHAPFVALYPYDLPSVAFFTAGVYLIATRRFWLLLPVFIVGCFNRETMLFLIPLFVMDRIVTKSSIDWRRLKRPQFLGQVTALCVVWSAVHFYVLYRFRGNHGEFYPLNVEPVSTHQMLNLFYMTRPKFWAQFDNACAYMLPFIILLRRYISPFRLRGYLVVLPIWVVTMMLFGLLPETRIYGELSGLVALMATLILEGYARERLGNRTSLEASHCAQV